ncbi:hypothetical protein MFIFM68171_09102 [Madurella fahalii]|uniref:Uncharacterized protein n=1 Tax=Madurella fahalii TaxID=1157608 RepID=A0ABQ0GMB1_9PEZI
MRKGMRSAFERKDQLQRNLQKCKYEPRDSEATVQSHGTSTSRSQTPKDSVSRKRKECEDDSVASGDDRIVAEGLKKIYEARLAALERKEQECQKERADLDTFLKSIRVLENKEAATD